MGEKEKLIRTGIVGSGFSASFHFEAVKKVYGIDIEIVGVYSKTPEKRRSFAQKRGIKSFDSLDELIDSCDVVHVCTPPATHEPIAVAALEKNRYAIVEKPFTGFFGDGSDDFDGRHYPKEKALEGALGSVKRMRDAEEKSKASIMYAENWVYAPPIQKEREIIEKTGAQILWMHGEEAHSGSHAYEYGFWKFAGGGAMIGKGCHPLTAALYLKRVEGISRNGTPIRPRTVSARIAELTRLDSYIDAGFIRTEYHDIEDFSVMHVTFEDGTIATIFASEIVLGGIHNWIEICANNHRTICNINPNNIMKTYNPKEENFSSIYVVEKIETKQGWSNPAPDEDWVTGYPVEMQAFYEHIAFGRELESTSELAGDVVATIYSGYLSAEQGGKEITIRTVA